MKTIIKAKINGQTKAQLFIKYSKGDNYFSKENDTWCCYDEKGEETPFGMINHWLDCKEPELIPENILTEIDLEVLESGQTRRYGDTHRFCNIYIKKCFKNLTEEDIIQFIEKYFDDRIKHKNVESDWWEGKYTLYYSEAFKRWEYRGTEPYLD